jgi:imidazolonepropionase-like amidohydrolase
MHRIRSDPVRYDVPVPQHLPDVKARLHILAKSGLFENQQDGAMASDVGADGGMDSLIDDIARLSQISNRTSLMTIDAVLRALPRDGQGYAAAAAELRTVARRVVHSTRDCGASLSEAR